MHKLILHCLIIMGFTLTAQSQNDQKQKDNATVHKLIMTLFDGMRQGDSAKVSSTFHKDVKMYTSFTDKEGQLVLKKGKLTSFLNAVGTPHDKIWDEKISGTKVLIDDGIAQVWTDYAFYVGTEFSHCGVNAFHLVKQSSGNWKIIHLMDTRRNKDCITDY